MKASKMTEPKKGDELKAADLLDAAADVLEHRGWTRYFLYRNAGNEPEYCALGALRSARRKLNLHYIILSTARLALSAEIGLIEMWNDKRAKDKYEVIEKMKQVAKDLRNNAII